MKNEILVDVKRSVNHTVFILEVNDNSLMGILGAGGGRKVTGFFPLKATPNFNLNYTSVFV